MSSNAGTSILDEALACIGQRIASILIQPAEKEQNYITSLHNEVLAAAWITGLLASSGSSPHIPEPVRIAFHRFSDIKNPGTYTVPDGSLPLRGGFDISVDMKFNLTEWWKIPEGEKLTKPFDVGEELVGGLLRALEVKLAAADLRTRTLNNFKEVLRQYQEIESCIESLKLFLERKSKYYDEKADHKDNLDS